MDLSKLLPRSFCRFLSEFWWHRAVHHHLGERELIALEYVRAGLKWLPMDSPLRQLELDILAAINSQVKVTEYARRIVEDFPEDAEALLCAAEHTECIEEDSDDVLQLQMMAIEAAIRHKNELVLEESRLFSVALGLVWNLFHRAEYAASREWAEPIAEIWPEDESLVSAMREAAELAEKGQPIPPLSEQQVAESKRKWEPFIERVSRRIRESHAE